MQRCCWEIIDNCFDMRGLLKIFIFAIALLLPCMMVGQKPEFFCKSPTKYVVKSKIVTKRSKDSYDPDFAKKTPKKFPIYYEKNEINLDGIPVHLFKFGEKPERIKRNNVNDFLVFKKLEGKNWDFISFNGDTIFKYSYNHENYNLEKSIFCIFSKSYEDSTDNYSYYRKYKDCHYSQNIKDSVYVFEQEHILCVKKKISDNRWEIIDKSYANRGVFEFGVSRIYGFIYVKADYGRAISEYWYR